MSLLAGCATMSADQLDARQYREVDHASKFRDYRSRCLSRGGRIYIAASQSLGRDGVPARGDRYFCG